MPIMLGLDNRYKAQEIAAYAAANGVRQVYIFYPERFPLDYPGARLVEYREIIMYRTFYPLLEEIGPDSLLVFNECLRTRNRNDLTYNCAHHYCNQTPHRLVFEHFPFIENTDDFMILLDLINKNRSRGKVFNWQFIAEEQITCHPRRITSAAVSVPVASRFLAEYERKKEELFAGLGESDPDTIPRQLHNWAGKFKKGAVCPDRFYVARNDRLKLSSVVTYREVRPGREYAVVDFPHRRLDFCDFLKTTGQERVDFLATPFKVDRYYYDELTAWIARLEEFYAQAGLCQQHRS